MHRYSINKEKIMIYSDLDYNLIKTFIEVYSSTYSVSENDSKMILRQLFEHGVIGNQPSMKGQQIFKRDGGADKNLDTYRDLKGDIDVFRRTEGKGAMYLSSDRICYRYGASTWLSQQRTPVYLDS